MPISPRRRNPYPRPPPRAAFPKSGGLTSARMPAPLTRHSGASRRADSRGKPAHRLNRLSPTAGMTGAGVDGLRR